MKPNWIWNQAEQGDNQFFLISSFIRFLPKTGIFRWKFPKLEDVKRNILSRMKGTTIISGFSHLPFIKLCRRHLYPKSVKIKMSVAKGFYSHRISSECPSSFHTKYQINPKRLKIPWLSHIQKNHRMQSLLEDVVISFIFSKNRIRKFS